jgi:hypothetical protein
MPAVRFPVPTRARWAVFSALAVLAVAFAGPATAEPAAVPSSSSSAADGSEITATGGFVDRAPIAPVDALITTKPVALGDFGNFIVDSARQRIYVPGSGSVLVTDLTGTVLQTLNGHAGANALVMVGSTLYVAGTSAITTINLTGTPANGPTLATGLLTPYGLEYAGGALWTVTGMCVPHDQTGTSAISRIDLSGTVTTQTGALAGLRCPVLSGAGNDLVVGDDGASALLNRYDVSAPTPNLLATTTVVGPTSVFSVSIDSGSSTVLVSYGSAKATESRSLATLAPVTTYGGVAGGLATSTDARGGLVAVGGSATPNIAVHPRGNPNALWAIAVPQYVFDLEFSPDGAKLYAYVADPSFTMQVVVIDVDDPTFPVESQYGEFHAIDPQRAFDSRATGRLTDSSEVQIGGLAGVPATGVSAVAVHVTATDATSGGYATVYPGGSQPPNTSTLNFGPGQSVPNMAIVGLSAQGRLGVYVSAPTHLIIDVVGWFGADAAPSGTLFHAVLPFRWFDTRTAPRANGAVMPVGPKARVIATATGGLPTSLAHLTAVAMNVTATNTTSESYLSVTPYTTNPSVQSSNLNWKAGEVVPNAVISKVDDAQGRVQFTNAFGSTDVIVDSSGYWDDGTLSTGARFHPVTPVRLADTRTGYLAPGSSMGHATRLGPNEFIMFQADVGLPVGTSSVVLNVTAVNPSAPGYISAYPAGFDPRTGGETSLVNFSPGAVRPNMTIMPLGSAGEIMVFNSSAGSIDILVDITGYFA